MILSLFAINRHLNNVAYDILQEEAYLLEARVSTALTSLEGSAAPVSMITNHLVSTIQELNAGKRSLPPSPSMQLEEDFGIFSLFDADSRWGFISVDASTVSPEDFRLEMSILLAMADLFETVQAGNPDTFWTYFVSAEGFLFSVPSSPLLSTGDMSRIYTRQYWINAIPRSNPDLRLVLSKPYIDLSGKGAIVTLSQPVVADGYFHGVLCMDVSTDVFKEVLKIGSSLGISSFIDEQRRIVTSSGSAEPGSYYGYLSDSVRTYGAFLRSGRNYVYERSVLQNELTLTHRIPISLLNKRALIRGLPLVISLFGLNILVFLILRLRQSYLTVAGERDFSRRLLSIVSHDLQTPLSVTSQATEVLMTDRNWSAVELIQRSSTSALSLLKDLSYWGKSRLGEVQIYPQPCSIAGVFERVLGTVRPSAEFKGITLETSSSVSNVLADPDVLATVLRNLISNAMKFSRPDRSVRLEALEGGSGYALIRISDDGDGMNEDQVKRIMDRKAVKSLPGTRGEKGSGIGLSLVTGLCDQAGWPISLTSQIDVGTTFSLSVPLV